MNILDWLKRFHRVLLFTKVGDPIDVLNVPRIWSWDEWKGPEDPLVEELGPREQAMFDALFPDGETTEWKTLRDGMVRIAKTSAPYDHDYDIWYGPNAAVWHAAWTFALEAVYLDREADLPSELVAQLYWFNRGHWPCSLADFDGGDDICDYIVY